MTELPDLAAFCVTTSDMEKAHQQSCTTSAEPNLETKPLLSPCVENIIEGMQGFMEWGENHLKKSTHRKIRFWT